MGYIRHDAVIVTSFDKTHLTTALKKAKQLGLPVSGIVESNINHYVSFLIAPDGSKEGWAASAEGDQARDTWKAWANNERKAGELWLYWAHVSYAGDDVKDCKIIEHHTEDGG